MYFIFLEVYSFYVNLKKKALFHSSLKTTHSADFLHPRGIDSGSHAIFAIPKYQRPRAYDCYALNAKFPLLFLLASLAINSTV